MLLWIALGGAVLAIVVTAWLGYRRNWRWTGLPADPGDGTSARPPQPAKTLWDWLQLLVVPLVLAAAAFALNASQAARDRQQQDDQARQERRVTLENARDEALRIYLRQMSDLIADRRLRELPAQRPRPTDAQALARTLTLVVLQRLDGSRKAVVLQFLWETGLIGQTYYWAKSAETGDRWMADGQTRLPIVRLNGADLSGLEMEGRRLALPGAPFEAKTVGPIAGPGDSYQHRSGVDLSGANLRGADFSGANLGNASFLKADLRGADFGGAILGAAIFRQSCLSGASFQGASLAGEGASPGAEIGFAEGHGIDFGNADLGGADLRSALLTDVAMDGASTRGTRFPEPWTDNGNPGGLRYAPNRCRPRPEP